MARVEITIPDELYDRAVEAGIDVSDVMVTALNAELGKATKIAEFDAYLEELEVEGGLPPEFFELLGEGAFDDDEGFWVD